MKHQVSTLEGALLDAAVAKVYPARYPVEIHVSLLPPGVETTLLLVNHERGTRVPFSPSTDWAIGGPLIDRERINIVENGASWSAGIEPDGDGSGMAFMRGQSYGRTHLIAAMRALVVAKLGPEVDL